MNLKFSSTYFISLLFFLSLGSSIQGQTPCSGGMAGSYPCNNIDLMAFLPLSSLGGGSLANDIWGWVDPLSGKEYAIMGKNSGTAFIDVTDPVNPIYLGSLPPHAGNSSWRDIKVYKDHAFIGSEASGSGIQIFDLNNLRNVISPPVAFSETAFKSIGGSNRSHNIVINENSGYVFSVGTSNFGSGGPVFFNAQNPAAPVYEGAYSLDGYTHDAQAIIYLGPDKVHLGKEIIFASNEDTQTIIDVTNKSAPTELSKTTYNGSTYTHQGWVTKDHKYLIFNDELDESNIGVNTTTYVFDISDLDSPVLAGTFVNTTAAIDHNLYIRGNYVYQSNYGSGLRILQMNDISTADMFEVGFFDVFPANDLAEYNGTWSNYPYFPSGNIIVSSMSEGLFIVRPNNIPHFELRGPEIPIGICAGEEAVFDLEINSLYDFSGPITLTHTGSPAGGTVSLNSNALTITNTASITAGKYSITIEGTSSGIKHSISVGLIVSDVAPAPTTLTSPLNGGIDIQNSSSLEWNASAQADSYEIEIAYDAAFNDIVETANSISNTSFSTTSLKAGLTYYWRVRANKGFCFSPWSATWNFTTSLCQTYISNDIPIFISGSGTPTVISSLAIPIYGKISDVNLLNLSGTHTNISDLRFTLTAPDNTSVLLISSVCNNEDNFNISFDDEAISSIIPCPPTDGNTYKPLNPLSVFNGHESKGTWLLTIEDLETNNGGNLNTWTLEVCYSSCNLYVNNNTSSGSGSLPEALVCASEGESITFASSLGSTTINLGAATLLVDKDLNIIGNALNNITLTSTGALPTLTINPGISLSLFDFEISSGSATRETVLNNGSLTLQNMTIQNTMGNYQIINSPTSQLIIKGVNNIKK